MNCWRSVAVCLAVVLSAAILYAQTSATSPGTGDQQQVTKPSGGGRYDAEIQKAVSEELRKHDDLKNVTSSVEDGIVTLQGTVDLYQDKEQAYRRIRKKQHVQGVRNQIQVAGKDIPDAQLREILADKLRYDRIDQGIMFNNFTIAVNNGVVSIGGQARTPSDAASALAIVENTQGVKDVIENIDVLPASPMDDDIRLRVARAIYGDPALRMYASDPQAPIRIVVQNGRVSLYGVVMNKMHRQIAEMRAREVPNVFSVTNNIQVASGTKPS